MVPLLWSLLFLDGVIQGIVTPVLPRLEIDAFQDTHVFSVMGAQASGKAVSALIASYAYGSIIDRQGCGKALPLVALGFICAPMAVFLALWPGSMAVPWFVIADGICGSNVPFLSLLVGLISKKTQHLNTKDRTDCLSYGIGFFFIGLVGSPALAVLTLHTPDHIIFVRRLFSASLCASLGVVGIVLTTEATAAQAASRTDADHETITSPGMLCVLCLAFFSHIAETMVASMLALYLTTTQGFTADDMAIFYGLAGTGTLICMCVTVPQMQRKYGMLSTLQCCLSAQCVMLVLFSENHTKIVTYGIVATMSTVATGVIPIGIAVVATLGGRQQGKAQGVLASVKMIAEIGSPLVFGQIFLHTVKKGGVGFLVAAAFVGIALAISVVLRVAYWDKSLSLVSQSLKESEPEEAPLLVVRK